MFLLLRAPQLLDWQIPEGDKAVGIAEQGLLSWWVCKRSFDVPFAAAIARLVPVLSDGRRAAVELFMVRVSSTRANSKKVLAINSGSRQEFRLQRQRFLVSKWSHRGWWHRTGLEIVWLFRPA